MAAQARAGVAQNFGGRFPLFEGKFLSSFKADAPSSLGARCRLSFARRRPDERFKASLTSSNRIRHTKSQHTSALSVSVLALLSSNTHRAAMTMTAALVLCVLVLGLSRTHHVVG